MFRFEIPFQVSVPGCPLGFLFESDDLTARLQSLFAIVSEIPTQLTAFLNKLFQLGIHSGISILRTALMGTASDSAHFGRLRNASRRFDRDPTDNISCMLS